MVFVTRDPTALAFITGPLPDNAGVMGHAIEILEHAPHALFLRLPELTLGEVETEQLLLLGIQEFTQVVKLYLAQQRGNIIHGAVSVAEDSFIKLEQQTEQQNRESCEQ